MIVAYTGVEAKKARGSFTSLGGLRRFDLDGAESVGAYTDQELPVGGLGDIEAVEHGFSLITLCAGDVGLAVLISNDAGDKADGIAVIMSCGIEHVHEIESGESFLGRNLIGIDGLRGFVHIDGFAYFAHVRDGNFHGVAWGNLNVRLLERVETFFFDTEKVDAAGHIR